MAMRPVDPQISWRDLSFFHDNFASTEEVARFIKRKAKGKPSHFLLRPSNRDRKLLTASILCKDGSVRHTHIYTEPNGGGYMYFLVVEKKFKSVRDLVTFYETNPVKNLENVTDVYFKYPICREDTLNGSGSSMSLRSMSRGQSFNGSHGSQLSLHRVPSADACPPLPQRPRTLSSNDSSGTLDFNLSPNGSTSSGLNVSNVDIASRPPLPLPSQQRYDDGQVYVYSKARNVDEDISEKLKEVLKSNERCECGIPRILAELPLGWTVHLSKDALTMGKLFYQNDQGLTSWTLPQEVKQQLTKIHIQNLQKIDKNWKFPH